MCSAAYLQGKLQVHRTHQAVLYVEIRGGRGSQPLDVHILTLYSIVISINRSVARNYGPGCMLPIYEHCAAHCQLGLGLQHVVLAFCHSELYVHEAHVIC